MNAAPPAAVLGGASDVSAGTGLGALMVNVRAFEVPPPGVGFTTVTGTVPWVPMSLAGIAAVTWPALTNVVVRATPFQRTSEVPTKLLPFTVSVNAAPPAAVLGGASDVSAGTGLGALMVNVRAFEVPPPGAGVTTVTGALPAVAMSLARIAAVTWPAFTNVVVRATPFQRTCEVATKLLPFTVSVNAAPPAAVLGGASDVSAGTGLGALMVNVRAFEVPPPGVGFTTVTGTVPWVPMSLAGIAAVTWPALTNVVVRATPFQRTSEVPTKLLPFTVSVNAAPPAAVLGGASDVSAGTGLGALMVNVRAFEVPPPGVGFTTVTGTVPWVTMSLAGIAAVTWPAFTNVVVRATPFQRTCEVATKLLPFTVSVNAAPPAAVLGGASDVSPGTGFAAALMVNVKAFEATVLRAQCFAVPTIGSPNTLLVQAVPPVRILKKYDPLAP